MKTLKFTIATIILMASSVGLVSAQKQRMKHQPDSTATETRVIVIGVTSPQEEILIQERARVYFDENMVKGFQQPKAPQFLITDRKSKAVFAIGGFVQFRTGYDFNNVIGNTDFVTYNIPMTSTPSNHERFLMDGSTSRLYFKTLVNTRPLGTIETYIETDFRGGNNVLRLRQAYIKFLGITLGQTTSLMTDLGSSFNTIDFEGPNAYTYLRNLGIHYNLDLGKGFSMAAGLEYPTVSATVGNNAELIPQRIPDIPLYFQYAWAKNQSHVRLTGLLRNMYYYDRVNASTEHQVGYGAQFSTTIKIIPAIQFYGNAIYGKGIGNYVNDLEGNGMDLIPSSSVMGKLDAPETFAWLAGAQFNLTKRMPMTIGYSQVRQYGSENYMQGNGYKLSQYIVGNLFYNINRSFSVGVEYLYGTRYDNNGNFGKANRVQAMAQFNF